MGLDTKYRPTTFSDVLGQDAVIDVLRRLLSEGRVYEQSYVFAGPSGSGKTTIGRILARAMLCDNLRDDGEPCNECESCREILKRGQSHAFSEMDAANNSGKADVERLLESLDYHTLGGSSRRIYLLDEAHALSSSAMDALLKPMEDTLPDSQDRRLTCMLCTTEPENLRSTIRGRCMNFRITRASRSDVVERMKWICEQEGFQWENEALGLIHDQARGHMRDTLVNLGRVANAGPVTVEAVKRQLGLEVVSIYYEILESIQGDPNRVIDLVREAMELTDPRSILRGIGEAALNARRVSEGVDSDMPALHRAHAEKTASSLPNRCLTVAKKALLEGSVSDRNALICRLMDIRDDLLGVRETRTSVEGTGSKGLTDEQWRDLKKRLNEEGGISVVSDEDGEDSVEDDATKSSASEDDMDRWAAREGSYMKRGRRKLGDEEDVSEPRSRSKRRDRTNRVLSEDEYEGVWKRLSDI